MLSNQCIKYLSSAMPICGGTLFSWSDLTYQCDRCGNLVDMDHHDPVMTRQCTFEVEQDERLLRAHCIIKWHEEELHKMQQQILHLTKVLDIAKANLDAIEKDN